MIRSSLLFALVIVAAGVLTPQSAMASCGDWLAHPDQVRGSLDSDEMADPSPMLPQPCSGPHCNQSPERPVPTPAPPASERHHHEVACVLRESSAMDICGARLIAELHLVLPGGNPLGIERPPQV